MKKAFWAAIMMVVTGICSKPWEMDMIVEPTNENESQGGIYVGDYHSAQDMSQLGLNQISAVLTILDDEFLAMELKDTFERVGIKHLVLDAPDQSNFDISVHFKASSEFLEQNLKEGNVLVHCLGGFSRSPTLVAAYLMKSRGLSAEEAIQLLKVRREVTKINSGFSMSLQKYEGTLLNMKEL